MTNRSWLLRFERGGRERWMGFGPTHVFSLREARERARAARQLLADGIDPIAHRDAERRKRALEARQAEAIPTFEEASNRYYAVHGGRWHNLKHAKQFLSTLRTYAFPKLGKLRVNEMTTEDVRLVLEPVWSRVPETASRVRGRIESVLSWAIANKYRVGPNPARWADNIEHLLPARSQLQKPVHLGALAYAELPAFWSELVKREGVAAKALAFAILTAGRTSEVIGARWDEIDLKERTWTVPSSRMKAGKEHRVPLSAAACEILNNLPREEANGFCFIGRVKGAPLNDTAMLELLKRMGRRGVTVHGFRSCFMDWAHECTAFPKVVIDKALAHTVGDKVEAAYRRGDLFQKRRALMDAWGRYCSAKPAATAEVVALRRMANP
jgi:integrase